MGGVVSNKNTFLTNSVTNVIDSKINISSEKVYASVIDSSYNLNNVQNKSYPLVDLLESLPVISFQETLPFRIKITNIGIDSYTPNNPAPIGIAIIGYNNYIL